MNNKKENHFKASYIDDLKLINGIHFTAREIDITACLLNARGTSRIASLLEISPRTVANHIRNLMVKLECNSREGIIDFIEKDNKQALLRTHYSHLSLEKAFQDALKAVRKLVYKTPSYSIIPGKGKKGFCEQAEKIKTHLERAGLTLHLEIRKKHTSIVDLIEEAKKEKYGIYIISTDLDEIQNIAFSKNISSNNQMSPNALFLFMEKLGLGEIPHALDGIKCIDFTRFENYYFSVFEVLKALFPHINIENTIEDFKKRYERTYESVEAKNYQKRVDIPKELPFTTIKSNIFRVRGRTIFLMGVITISILTIGMFTFKGQKERVVPLIVPTINQTQNSIRSDLLLPNKERLLERPELIAEINNKFKEQKGIQTVAIVGIGGAGKTTLARHYAHQQNANIIWEINAETRGSLNESFETLGSALAKTERDQKILKEILATEDATTKKEKTLTFVKEHLKSQESWFLVYDNVENFSDVQKYFPQDMKTWGEGKVLLTTRNNNIPNSSYINQAIYIGELSPKQKLNLFVQIMNHGEDKKLTATQIEKVEEFLKHIPPFPLDISVAAYYLKTANISYTQYTNYLNKDEKNFTATQEHFLKEMGEYANTRYSIITLSLQNIMKIHPDFEDLLLLISLLDSQSIPRELLDHLKNSIVVDNFIYHLKKYSLITTDSPILSVGSALSLHRSTQAIILTFSRINLSLEKTTSDIANILETYIDKTIEEENFPKIKALLIHTNAFLSHSDIFSDEIKGTIAGKLGLMYFHVGDCPDAQQNLELSLATLNINRTKNLDKISHVLGYLGSVYKDIGNYEKAKIFLNKSLSIYKNKVRKNDPIISWTLIYLGNVYRSLGDYKKARELYAETLATQVAFYGEKHPKTVWSLACLAHSCMQLGDYKQAKDLMEKSLAIYKKHFSKENHGSAWVAVYVGRLYNILGQPKNAEKLLKETLKIHLNYYGNNHIKTAWCYRHLGHTFAILGNFQDAKIMLECALRIYKQHYGEDHYKFAAVLLRLGAVYREMGDYKKSKDILKQSLKVYNKYYKKDHIEIARVLRELAQVYVLEGNLHIGENLGQKVLLISQQHKDPEEFIALEILADIFLKKSQKSIHEIHYNADDKEKAKSYLKKALEIVKIHFPEDSLHIARIKDKFKKLK